MIYHVQLFYREIRECLKLDPDHKLCHTHYKIVKKIDRLVVDTQSALNIKDFSSSIQFAKKVKYLVLYYSIPSIDFIVLI